MWRWLRTVIIILAGACAGAWASPLCLGAGLANNFLQFNGTNGKVTVPNSAAAFNLGAGSYGVCWWQYGYSTDDQNREVFSKQGPGAIVFIADWFGGVFTFSNQDSVNLDTVDYDFSVVTNNQWMFIAVVKDSVAHTMTLYLNAVSISSMPDGGANSDNSLEFIIGTDTRGPDFFDRGLDDLRIYTHAITQADVTFLYGGGTGVKYALNQLPSGFNPSFVMQFDDSSDPTKTVADVSGLTGTFSETGVTYQSGGVPFASGGSGAGGVPILDEQWTW